ncbi:MAG: MTH938/NDUFAF3 family protein [Mariprofundaceae bacterium]
MSSSLIADVGIDGGTLTPLFRGYDDDYLQIHDQRYHHAIAIHNNQIIEPWHAENLATLSCTQLEFLTENPPRIFILGTGRKTSFPAIEIRTMMENLHIGLECMDSRAAARTYNILISEGRTVSVAAWLPAERN